MQAGVVRALARGRFLRPDRSSAHGAGARPVSDAGLSRINDSLGHETGDLMLGEIGKRLGHRLCGADMAAGFGGDELIAVLGALERIADVEIVARDLIEVIAAPLVMGD
nr:diguanylate cyclase [Thiorhodococcus minor]